MEGKISHCFFLILVFSAIHISHAQSTTYGADFYIGILRYLWTYKIELSISTLSLEFINFTVETGTGWNYTGEVSVYNATIVTLPRVRQLVPQHGNYSERYKGIHVHSSAPISVVVNMIEWEFSDQYIAYPYTDLGLEQYEYYVVSAETPTQWSAFQSLFLLVGNVNDTTITIAPTQSIEVPTDPQDINSTVTVINPGSTHTIILHQMQTLLIGSSTGDLTGTAIISNKPLTVISGHECGTLSNERWWTDMRFNNDWWWWWGFWECNYLTEQIPPTATWGKRFLLVPFPRGIVPHYNKIIASAHDTTVTQTCNSSIVQTISLSSPGDWNRDVLNVTYDPETYCTIESDKPILVMQFTMEDHTYIYTRLSTIMSIVPPVEQYINTVVYFPLNTSRNNYYDQHYIQLTSTTDNSSVLLDGESYMWNWTPINDHNGNTVGYGTIHYFNDTNTHVLHHTNTSAGLSVIAYGNTTDPHFSRPYVYLVGMKLNILTEGALQLNPWYGHILGGVPIVLSGPPYFKYDDTVLCRFDNIEVIGKVINNTQVVCITPRLTTAGRIPVQLYLNSLKYESESSFYSKQIEHDYKVSIMSNDLLFFADNVINITWVPTSLTDAIGSINTSNLLIDIKLHIFTNNSIEEISSALANDVANTGFATVTVPTISHPIGLSAYTGLISIEAKNNSVQGTTTLIQWTDLFWIATTADSIWSACKTWTDNEPASIGNVLATKVRSNFPCPPTIDQARTINSGLVQDINTKRIHFFHPNADKCYHQRTVTRATDGSGNQCCYDNSGNLIVGPTSGGSVDKVSHVTNDGTDYLTNLIGHQYEDLLPNIYCCKGSQSNCVEYYKRRPSDNGTAYVPPIPAWAIGDPHIFTLDQHKYTFNGKGEFVLVDTIDNSFTLQGRMIEPKDSTGQGTVFSACVAKTNTSSTVQFEIETKGYDVFLICLINGKRFDFNEVKSQEFTSVTVSDLGNNTFSATFTSGAFLQVQVENGFMSAIGVSLPDHYYGKTSGLMGIYNDDETDDLTPRGNNTAIPLNSTLQTIHNEFGITWIIDNEADSLFTYQFTESWATYYYPSFTPVYNITFTDPGLEQTANEICGDDEFCKFDIAATGRVEIGEATLTSGKVFEQLVNLSQPITCDPPCVHGACVSTDVCVCGEGYSGVTCDTIVTSPCINNPCNGGSCQYHAGSYICTCLPGLTGVFCDETDTTISTSNNAGLIAGVIIGIIVALTMVATIIVVIAVAYFRRVKRRMKRPQPKSTTETKFTTETKSRSDADHEMDNVYETMSQ